MDTKKTNLTPELKEIYDRVMNTSASPQKATPLATSEPLQPTASMPPVAQTSSTPPASTATPPTMASVAPTPSTTPVASAPQQPEGAAPIMPPMEVPSMPAMPGTAEEALTNTPARPISEGNTFSLKGASNSSVVDAQKAAQMKPPKGKFKISIPLLIGVGFVFIAVWGVFWAIIFGFIKH